MDFFTKHALKKVTNNLGKLQIDEDRIICYVNNKRLFDELTKDKELFVRNLILNSVEDSKKSFKPIYYIIENYRFDFSLKIKTDSNTHIIFKKCSFFDQIYIEEANDITFERNRYYCTDCLFLYGLYFLNGQAKNLKFINDKFCNSEKDKEINFFGINLDVDNLEIKNSNIEINEFDRDIVINAKNINLYNSTISSNDIKIKTDKLNSNNSKINSSTKIILDDESSKNNNNIIMGLKAPKIIYNGIDLSRSDEISHNLDKKELRNTLICQLKVLRDETIKINENRLNSYKNKIDNENIVKVIKSK